MKLAAGTTSKILRVFVQDSRSNAGAGLTGLAYNAAGLVASYAREGAGRVAISLVTASVGTYTSSGWAEVDATNMPGWYELGLPNAAIAAGSAAVEISLQGAANMVPVAREIELDQPTNFAAFSIDGLGRVDVGRWLGAAVLLNPDNLPQVNVDEIAGVEATYPLTAVLADGVTHGGTSAVLSLKQLRVDNPDGGGDPSVAAAVYLSASSASGMALYGTGYYGLHFEATEAGILANGGHFGIEANANDGGGSGIIATGQLAGITLQGTITPELLNGVPLSTQAQADVESALNTQGLTSQWASDVDSQATSAATNAQTAATKSTAVQADYQQRGQEVTLPAAPVGYGGTQEAITATGESITVG